MVALAHVLTSCSSAEPCHPFLVQVCARIDAVTADDIMDVARRALQSRPSVAAVGADLSCVLSYEEILQTLYALQSGKAFGRR